MVKLVLDHMEDMSKKSKRNGKSIKENPTVNKTS